MEEKSNKIYATLDWIGRNQQFSVIETPTTCDTKHFSLLIDFESSHYFLSPTFLEKLGLESLPVGKRLKALMANGSQIEINERIIDLQFDLTRNLCT